MLVHCHLCTVRDSASRLPEAGGTRADVRIIMMCNKTYKILNFTLQ